MPGQLVIGDIFRNAARAVPGRVAAALGDDVLTFAELDAAADAMTGALHAAGVRQGSRVVVWTGTALDVLPLFAGLARLGAVYAPIAGNLGAAEAVDIAASAGPALIVVDALRVDGGAELAEAAGCKCVTLIDLASADAAPAPPVDVAETDPHVIFFTSGSTDRPKGAVLSHRTNFLRSHPGALLEPRGAMVCTYPLFHMGAWTISLQQWQARDAVVYLEEASGPAIVDAVRRHAATRLNCVPAVWRRVFDELGPGGQLPSLRFADTGTSATPPDLLNAIGTACPNAVVRVFYGSTEAGNVASACAADLVPHPGSVGPPSTGTEVRLSDEGEICVRGPLLFDGYFGDPAATDAAPIDGWYHSGDVAAVDADGYLTIVGRLGEVIRTGGESVNPVEVEAILATAAGVAEVAVVGVPDADWGEVVCAVIVADGTPPTLDELRAACAGRLAPFKQPRRLHVVDALPRTPATGQVQRRALVSLFQAGEPRSPA